MNKEINKIDDLFDNSIGRSLRRMGYIFPSTAADFKRIEEEISKEGIKQPEGLKDPFEFIGKRKFKKALGDAVEDQNDYSLKLAQAAREGKEIPEDIKKKMAEDKLHYRQDKKDN